MLERLCLFRGGGEACDDEEEGGRRDELFRLAGADRVLGRGDVFCGAYCRCVGDRPLLVCAECLCCWYRECGEGDCRLGGERECSLCRGTALLEGSV